MKKTNLLSKSEIVKDTAKVGIFNKVINYFKKLSKKRTEEIYQYRSYNK
jgi:hypothetical protein